MCVGPDGSRSGKSRPALVHLGKKILKWKALSPFLAKNEWQQKVQLETNATFFDEMWVSCSRTERKSINCRIVFVVIPRAPVYRVVFKKKKFEISNTKNSYDKMRNDCVRSGWMGNIWLSVMALGPLCCARSVRHDLEPNIFPSGPPTQSISKQYLTTALNW